MKQFMMVVLMVLVMAGSAFAGSVLNVKKNKFMATSIDSLNTFYDCYAAGDKVCMESSWQKTIFASYKPIKVQVIKYISNGFMSEKIVKVRIFGSQVIMYVKFTSLDI